MPRLFWVRSVVPFSDCRTHPRIPLKRGNPWNVQKRWVALSRSRRDTSPTYSTKTLRLWITQNAQNSTNPYRYFLFLGYGLRGYLVGIIHWGRDPKGRQYSRNEKPRARHSPNDSVTICRAIFAAESTDALVHSTWAGAAKTGYRKTEETIQRLSWHYWRRKT